MSSDTFLRCVTSIETGKSLSSLHKQLHNYCVWLVSFSRTSTQVVTDTERMRNRKTDKERKRYRIGVDGNSNIAWAIANIGSSRRLCSVTVAP